MSLLALLWIGFLSEPAPADDPPRLPGGKTFDRLESRLADIQKSRFAETAKKEIEDAGRLLGQGRLWALAGRLKKAGRAANILDATLLLAALKVGIAEKKQAVEEALQQNVRLEKESAARQVRLKEILSKRQNPALSDEGSNPVRGGASAFDAVRPEGDSP